jgi:hypothetical protein
MNALKHGLSRKLPPAEAHDPRVLPLARALAGEGVTNPVALAAAEEIAVASLSLSSICLMRASLIGGKGAAVSEAEARMGSEWSRDLVQLERFERQAFTRRNRAVRRLEHALAQSSHHAAGGL